VLAGALRAGRWQQRPGGDAPRAEVIAGEPAHRPQQRQRDLRPFGGALDLHRRQAAIEHGQAPPAVAQVGEGPLVHERGRVFHPAFGWRQGDIAGADLEGGVDVGLLRAQRRGEGNRQLVVVGGVGHARLDVQARLVAVERQGGDDRQVDQHLRTALAVFAQRGGQAQRLRHAEAGE